MEQQKLKNVFFFLALQVQKIHIKCIVNVTLSSVNLYKLPSPNKCTYTRKQIQNTKKNHSTNCSNMIVNMLAKRKIFKLKPKLIDLTLN